MSDAEEDYMEDYENDEYIPKEIQPEKNCRSRLEELALPKKTAILHLWKYYAKKFSKDRLVRIKLLLQELYAMTPEETQKYFARLKENEEKKRKLKKIRRKVMLLYRRKRKRYLRKAALRFFEIQLKRGMTFAVRTPVPPIVSVRLRNLSNLVLEQLCDLRCVEIPDRGKPDKLGHFLITISDWFAIGIERLYYMIQLRKNRELDEIADMEKAKRKAMREIKLEPKVSRAEEEGAEFGDEFFDEMIE